MRPRATLLPWLGLLLLVLVAPPSASAQIPPEAEEQPPEARTFQESEFPRLIGVVKGLGLVPDAASRLFWWQVPGDVGPLVLAQVPAGSAAAAAGLQAGDVVEELRGIPHFLAPGELQDLAVTGGAVQVGYHVERSRSLGAAVLTLGVRRGATTFETDLPL